MATIPAPAATSVPSAILTDANGAPCAPRPRHRWQREQDGEQHTERQQAPAGASSSAARTCAKGMVNKSSNAVPRIKRVSKTIAASAASRRGRARRAAPGGRSSVTIGRTGQPMAA